MHALRLYLKHLECLRTDNYSSSSTLIASDKAGSKRTRYRITSLLAS